MSTVRGEGDGAMTDNDINQGEVFWIGPDVCFTPHWPEGFPFRVVDFLGRGGVDKRNVPLVWLRGPLLDERGTPVRVIQLCVPVDQPRAVPVNRFPRPVSRTEDDDVIIGPRPNHRRAW
jgi:hypothetical protein